MAGARDRHVHGQDEHPVSALGQACDQVATAATVPPDVQLEPAIGTRGFRCEPLDRRRPERREGVRDACPPCRTRDRGLAGRVHHPRESRRAEDERKRRLPPEDRRRRIDRRDVTQHVWAEHDAVEGRDRSIPAQLELGSPFDIVEHRPRRSPSRTHPKVRDRAHTAPTIGRPGPKSRPDEPRKISWSGDPPLQPGHLPSVDDRRPLYRGYAPATPPSTLSTLPVLLPERAGDARKTTASATSAGTTFTFSVVRAR